MIGYIRLEILRLIRNGGYLMMSLVMPVGLYLTVAGGGPDQESLARSMVGAAAFGALGVVITNGTGIAEDRALGWLRQLRLTPLSPAQVVVARGAVATCLGIMPIVVIGLVGALYKGVHLSAGTWLEVFLLLWVGIAPLAMLGIGIGYLFPAQLAQIAGTLSYLSLTLLGGLMLPVSSLPSWARPLSRRRRCSGMRSCRGTRRRGLLFRRGGSRCSGCGPCCWLRLPRMPIGGVDVGPDFS
jgi:ABC-2 type transport system permease protein